MRVLTKLMNSFVVALMNQPKEPNSATQQHAAKITVLLSERQLEGYCSFHHMLLALGMTIAHLLNVYNFQFLPSMFSLLFHCSQRKSQTGEIS